LLNQEAILILGLPVGDEKLKIEAVKNTIFTTTTVFLSDNANYSDRFSSLSIDVVYVCSPLFCLGSSYYYSIMDLIIFPDSS
jgi:hypothetical protein